MLRGYQGPGEFLNGWILVSQWTLTDGEGGESVISWNVANGQDWFRTLGILRAGSLKLEREYLTPDDEAENG